MTSALRALSINKRNLSTDLENEVGKIFTISEVNQARGKGKETSVARGTVVNGPQN